MYDNPIVTQISVLVGMPELNHFQDNDINQLCSEILDNYQSFKTSKDANPSVATSEDLNNKLSKLLESQSLATSKPKTYTEEEKKIRYLTSNLHE